MKLIAKFAATAAAAMLCMSAHAALVIDDFTVAQGVDLTDPLDPQPILGDSLRNDGLGSYSSVNGATSSVLGGQRDLFVMKRPAVAPCPGAPGDQNGCGSGSVDAFAVNGAFTYNSPSNSIGTAILKWDGVNEVNTVGASASALTTEANFMAGAVGGPSGLNPFGLGALNFNAAGDAFLISVLNNDLVFDFALTVYSFDPTLPPGPANVRWTTLVVQSLLHPPAGDTPIMFTDFESNVANEVAFVLPSGALRFTSANGGANLDQVGALVAQLNVSNTIGSVDLRIGNVGVVPEPGSLALAGLALAGLGLMRRRTTKVA